MRNGYHILHFGLTFSRILNVVSTVETEDAGLPPEAKYRLDRVWLLTSTPLPKKKE